MSLEKRKPIETEPTPNEVVRVLLFQSANPDMLPDDADPKTVELTRMVMTIKGGANANGLLMPVGGGRERKPNGQFSESVIDAALREMIEETHAKTKRDRLVELPVEQQYTFTHKATEERRTQVARYCLGRLLPGDSMYPLDQAEDKIASFAYLTPSQYKDLVINGSVALNGREVSLVEHMQYNADNRADVTTEDDSVHEVHQLASYYFARMEAIKKLKVLDYLLYGTRPEDSRMKNDALRPALAAARTRMPEAKALLKTLLAGSETSLDNDTVAAIHQTKELWSEIIETTDADIQDIRQALEYSNTEGVLENVAEHFDIESGKGIPSISLIFPLLAGDKKLDTTELRILLKNPQAARLLKIVGTVRAYTLDTTSKHYGNGQQLTQELYDRGLLPTNRLADINRHTNDVDGFFEMLQQQASGVEVAGSEPVVISVAEEIRGLDVDQLLEIIFQPEIALSHLPSAENRGVVLWEAKRKLILMLLMTEVDQAQQEIVALGTQLFRTIEQSLLKVATDSGRGARALVLGPRREEFPVQMWSPPKSLAQALRKVIARDRSRGDNRTAQEFLDDANRSAYVFDIVPEDNISNIEYVTIQTGGKVLDARNNPLEKIKTQKQIAYLIEGMLRVANEKGIPARIINYKPLPLPGEGFDSSGGGGKGKIRMAKFDLEVTRPDGKKQYKEYQIFVPGMRVIEETRDTETLEFYGGEDDFEDKKEDDKTRSMRRLFDTQGVRSAMEALFPVSVYGEDLRNIYRHRVGGGDKTRSRQHTPPKHTLRTGLSIRITKAKPRTS